MRIAYLKIINLDPHKREKLFLIGSGGCRGSCLGYLNNNQNAQNKKEKTIMIIIIMLIIITIIVIVIIRIIMIRTIHAHRSNKKELFSHESLDFLSLSRLFLLDLVIRSPLILLK